MMLKYYTHVQQRKGQTVHGYINHENNIHYMLITIKSMQGEGQ